MSENNCDLKDIKQVMNDTEQNTSVLLPKCPEKPLASDCCGNGCDPCVFDIYQDELSVWEAECCQILRGDEPHSRTDESIEAKQLKPDKYTSFLVESIVQETPYIKRIKCKLGPKQKLGLSIGQHIIIKCKNPNGSSITRQYTPISSIDTVGCFELGIKIYDKGEMSQLIKHWSVGEEILVRGPLGTFSYTRNKYECLLMICAGTGVAPMCQVVGSLLEDDLEETRLRLIYACPSYSQLMAKTELDEWSQFWNFSVAYVLSQESAGSSQSYRYGEIVINGYVNQELVEKELKSCPLKTCVLVCGTPAFEAAVLNILKELNLSKDCIHKF